MTLSKRLALLGVRSVSKYRGFGSSCGLIDRRPFQISKFTNDSNPSSKNSQMETIRVSSPEITGDYIRNLIEEVRAHVEKMRTEQAKAGFIYRGRFSYLNEDSNLSKNSHESKTSSQGGEDGERANRAKLRAELNKLLNMQSELVMSKFSMETHRQLSMEINDYNNTMSKHIRDLRASVADTSRQIAIWGTATAVLTPAIIFAIAFFSL